MVCERLGGEGVFILQKIWNVLNLSKWVVEIPTCVSQSMIN